ncbi:MAG: C-GCAxxG-C-C family protein [Christensenellales bacterium]|nr:C-GCAxxG-C-C family protein [Christensenellales bacterium]
MNHTQKARDLFLSGCSCSQAVFAAFADDFGMDTDTALRLASSFGGGMGGMRETCGAVTGMLMVAGLKWGYSDVSRLDLKTAHYTRVRSLIERFQAEHHTIVCRDLLAHLGTLKQAPSARTEAYYKERPCVLFVETAARLLDEMDEAE